MTARISTFAIQRQDILAAALIGAAVLLGGGGSPAPIPEMILQCVAALILASAVLVAPGGNPLSLAARPAWTIAILILILPVLQLLPLPPVLWQALPGRALMRESLGLVGEDGSWRPLSLAPPRTLASLLVLLPAALLLLLVAAAGRAGRSLAMSTFAVVAGLSIVVGAGQLAAGQSGAFRFYLADLGGINGFQANHNSAADILLIGLVGAIATLRDHAERGVPSRLTPRMRLVLAAGMTVLFAVATVLTASRAGIALLPLALIGVLILVRPWLRLDRRNVAWFALGTALATALGIVLLLHNAAFGRVLARFDFTGEFRPLLWRDAWFVAQQYLPWGAGLGAFVPVFLASEPLEVVDITAPNRAHNDYLELLVEGGIPGLILAATVLAIVGRLAWRAVKVPPAGSRAQVVFATTSLTLIALHSIVDYPLRSMSLAMVGALCAGLLVPLRGEPEGEKD